MAKAKTNLHQKVSVMILKDHHYDSQMMYLEIHINGEKAVALQASSKGMQSYNVERWFSDAIYNGLNQIRDTIR